MGPMGRMGRRAGQEGLDPSRGEHALSEFGRGTRGPGAITRHASEEEGDAGVGAGSGSRRATTMLARAAAAPTRKVHW